MDGIPWHHGTRLDTNLLATSRIGKSSCGPEEFGSKTEEADAKMVFGQTLRCIAETISACAAALAVSCCDIMDDLEYLEYLELATTKSTWKMLISLWPPNCKVETMDELSRPLKVRS
jgi:hypothetical protein